MSSLTVFSWVEAIANHRQLKIDSPDVTISFYGDGDSTYLVMEHYSSDTLVHQFVIDGENEESLKAVLSLLEAVNFNVVQLLEWLVSVPYKDSEEGLCYAGKKLKVVKKIITQK